MVIPTKISFFSFDFTADMVLQQTCLRIRPRIQSFHTTHNVFAAANKAPPMSKPTPRSSTASPFPPRSRPPENDPLYKHPPSSIPPGKAIRGVQLLKDKPDVVAMPDDYYPDWLWQLLEPPEFTFVQDRLAEKKLIEEKRRIYLSQLKDVETAKQLETSKKERVLKPGQVRTLEEKIAVRKDAQNEVWLAKREKEYDTPIPQFGMSPEHNRKFHKMVRKDKIKQDNYERARGMK